MHVNYGTGMRCVTHSYCVQLKSEVATLLQSEQDQRQQYG